MLFLHAFISLEHSGRSPQRYTNTIKFAISNSASKEKQKKNLSQPIYTRNAQE